MRERRYSTSSGREINLRESDFLFFAGSCAKDFVSFFSYFFCVRRVKSSLFFKVVPVAKSGTTTENGSRKPFEKNDVLGRINRKEGCRT